MFAETSYLNGAAVTGGQQLSWSGVIAPSGNPSDWTASVNDFINGLRQQGFIINKVESDYKSGNLAVNVTSPGGFADITDVKGLFDGIAGSAGLLFQGIFGNSRIQSGPQNLYTPAPTNIFGVPGGPTSVGDYFNWWKAAASGAPPPDSQGAPIIPGLPDWMLYVGLAIVGVLVLSGAMRH